MTNDKRTAQYKHNLESVCVCVLQLIATYNVWQIEIVCIDQFVAVLFLIQTLLPGNVSFPYAVRNLSMIASLLTNCQYPPDPAFHLKWIMHTASG